MKGSAFVEGNQRLTCSGACVYLNVYVHLISLNVEVLYIHRISRLCVTPALFYWLQY